MAGLFGFGGATIIVPLLFIVFTQIVITRNSDVFRIGTSLATIIVTSISSFMPHYKGAVICSVFKNLPPSMALGCLLSAGIAGGLSSFYLWIIVCLFSFE